MFQEMVTTSSVLTATLCSNGRVTKLCKVSLSANWPFSHPHAARHPEGSSDGGQYSDYDVQDFAPKTFVFHVFLSYDL